MPAGQLIEIKCKDSRIRVFEILDFEELPFNNGRYYLTPTKNYKKWRKGTCITLSIGQLHELLIENKTAKLI